jgi:hypothetical protein
MKSTQGRRFRYGVVTTMLMALLLVHLTGIPPTHALPRPPSPSPQLPPCPVDEGDGCPQYVPCAALNCVPLPINLYPVGPNIKGRDGLFASNDDCGSKSCGFLRCPCGPKFTNGDICNTDGGGGC